MTREEAITNLEMIRVAFVEPITKEQRKLINDTFDMAIKALEQEPCEDAISREMALKECYDIVVDGERYRVIQEETLLGLPSVTPSRRKGHWIIDGYDRKCSVCEVAFCETDDVGDYIPNEFCPNCGAEMESEEV